MPVIKIKQTLRFSDFDRYYEELNSFNNASEKLDLELPTQVSKSFFSITSSLIQFAASWLRTDYYGKLLVDLTNEPLAIQKMYEEEFFFPIVALAWNDIQIVNLEGLNMRPVLRDYQNDFILKMRRILPLKGEKLLLVNLDHFSNNNGILPFFETKNQSPTSEISLLDSLRLPVINSVLKYSNQNKNEFLTIFNDIAAIIYELMKNTFEWAKTDENGLPLSPNVRGLYIRFYKKTRALLLSDYEKNKPIHQYFSDDTTLQTNETGQIYFIEISVFDSGVGFVRKFRDDDIQPLNDIEIIKKCLIKNQTSDTGVFKDKKGIGLDRILRTLDKKGFLRIKTDKYCLYRNMIESPYQELQKQDFRMVELNDWYTQKPDEFTTTPFSSGSNISILYPLSIKPYTK
ncbi:hypothetical protein DIU31_024460 [Mucilaginibacter rubeus]|uniref:ATP-binding protein n=1 Tax=Mucilaginibacter rubeus TaxID=2027860 RepID=A0AAE6MK91_9SPHI|nr:MULTISPECIES: hypothetical protein [Mucilaginibacter]QEM06513.1 hypothetical protein DIU31_024460 [Mucilaginibacter rubeus]QEM19102.1 hypothetical protein DIU38_024725 [Mucilaginibacter gossypii]QTE44357.1 hypothetical protein J3L19_02995 [Mucilaginibacter rubeus]QTE50957.1 hypothetical protein J3L21_02970 [Mucilaginibacter rubeus]QTE56040.1 hypothetical protein J3L23_28205 [Mucilaginibacter rubeus]